MIKLQNFEDVPPKEIHRRLWNFYNMHRSQVMSVQHTQKWCRKISVGRKSIREEARYEPSSWKQAKLRAHMSILFFFCSAVNMWKIPHVQIFRYFKSSLIIILTSSYGIPSFNAVSWIVICSSVLIKCSILKGGYTLCVMRDLYAWCAQFANKRAHRELPANSSIYTICNLFFSSQQI